MPVQVLRFLSLVLLVCLSACVPLPTVQKVADLPPNAKTIVVVSAPPNTLVVATRGFTALGNHLDQPSIDDWHLPDVIYADAREALVPRFQVSEALPNAAVISNLTTALNNGEDLSQIVPQLATGSTPPDLYVVIYASTNSSPNFGTSTTPYYMADIGISIQLPPWGMPAIRPAVHTFLGVAIIDGKTAQVLEKTVLALPPNPAFDGDMLPVGDVPKGFVWHDNWASMTPDEKAQIHSKIEDLLRESIGFTLKAALVSQ